MSFLFSLPGEHAQKLYFNLKKRFHKRRNFLKRLQSSGTNNHILLKKARSDVSVYSFLDWLIPFTQVRQPRVPIKPEEANLLEAKYLASVESEEFLDERPSFVDLHYNNSASGDGFEHEGELYVKQEATDDDTMYLGDEEIITVRPSSPMNSSPTPQSSFGNHKQEDVQSDENHNITDKRVLMSTSTENPTVSSLNHSELTRKRTRDSSFSEPTSSKTTHPEHHNNVHHRHMITQDRLSNKISKPSLENHTTDSNNETSKYSDLENEDNLFGLMVGAELKGLPYKERCIAKLKIQNILFDMQMTALNKRNGVSEKKGSHTV